jgi:hypothetical protein
VTALTVRRTMGICIHVDCGIVRNLANGLGSLRFGKVFVGVQGSFVLAYRRGVLDGHSRGKDQQETTIKPKSLRY